MSDELQKGDWVVVTPWKRLAIQHCGGVFQFGEHTKYHYVGKTEPERVASLWGCGILTPLNAIRLATPTEIAAATGQPQEEIAVGDTVELLDRKILIVADKVFENTINGPQVGYTRESSAHYWFSTKDNCRLVSKGKSGQGENQKPAQPEKYPSHKPTGCTCSATAHPPCSWCESEHHCEECESADELVHTEKGRVLCETCFAKVACPACSGSIHGPGRIADWNDKPIACPRCQYGKPKPEPEVAKPYHKVLPSGECVIALIHDIGCKPTPTQADELTEKLHRDTEWDRQQARAALEKAQAEARRLGILK